MIFRKFAAELWPLLDFDWDFLCILGLLTYIMKAEAGL